MGEAKQKLEEKKKEFAKNPHLFIDKRNLVFAAMIKPDGTVGVILNRKQEAYYGVGLFRIQRLAFNCFNNEDIAKLKEKPPIQIPDNPDDIIKGGEK